MKSQVKYVALTVSFSKTSPFGAGPANVRTNRPVCPRRIVRGSRNTQRPSTTDAATIAAPSIDAVTRSELPVNEIVSTPSAKLRNRMICVPAITFAAKSGRSCTSWCTTSNVSAARAGKTERNTRKRRTSLMNLGRPQPARWSSPPTGCSKKDQDNTGPPSIE
jgi:hypothetical protein